MDDEREIIFIALTNSLITYIELLEELKESSQQEEIPMVEYLIERHEQLLEKYSDLISSEDNKPISRPSW